MEKTHYNLSLYRSNKFGTGETQFSVTLKATCPFEAAQIATSKYKPDFIYAIRPAPEYA